LNLIFCTKLKFFAKNEKSNGWLGGEKGLRTKPYDTVLAPHVFLQA
jgi:hypothetical protein